MERSVPVMTCMEAEKMVIPYINDQLSVTELEDFIEHLMIFGRKNGRNRTFLTEPACFNST